MTMGPIKNALEYLNRQKDPVNRKPKEDPGPYLCIPVIGLAKTWVEQVQHGRNDRLLYAG